jgi:polysaccharide chain length determinant protein (PEP-CTERM system associated)
MNTNIHEKIDLVVGEIRGAWRYRWTAIGVAWTIAIIGWFASYWIPNTYEASARVFVDSSTPLRPLLQGLAIDSGVQSQLDLVRRSLISKPQLEQIAAESGLIQRAETPQEQEFLIQRLEENITIATEFSPGNDILYTISFVDTDRAMSIAVVEMLLERFMRDVVGSKQEGQESAQQFLVDQIAEYERRLSEAETRLAEFKKRNLGLVPGERGDYFTRLQTEQDELDAAESNLRLLNRRQSRLEQQLSGELAFTGSPDDADQPESTSSRLRSAEARLQELLLRFTEKHPEVVALRETIEQLQARQEEELAALQAGVGPDGGAARANNPVYQQIQVSLNEVEVEIAALNGEIADRKIRIRELQSLLDTAPEVEAEFARLNRDYGVTRAQYDSLVQRLETARLSEMAEETGVVKFDVIDPPRAPTQPVGPNRGLLVTVSLVFGFVLGAGAAYARNLGNPVYFDGTRLRANTGLPVMGTIGQAFPESTGRVRSADIRSVLLIVGSLFVVYLAVVVWADIASTWLQNLAGAD